jgi:cytochrome c peroxidase
LSVDTFLREDYMEQAHIQRTLVVAAALAGAIVLGSAASVATTPAAMAASDELVPKGRRLFERETFGGNGRTCLTCHSRETGTVSPADARKRFVRHPADPLFRADGSDDGMGNGATRMVSHATILMNIPLAPNVRLAHDPAARTVTVRRGIPTTLNTPALDPVLMYDGRQPDLEAQALGAITDHAEATRMPFTAELQALASFQQTPSFFSSARLLRFARTGRAPSLPEGRTPSERRGRRFFEDAPFTGESKPGICAICHSGPMLNETNQFIPVPPFGRGGRFQSVFVSELNAAGNPVLDFLFENPDGSTTPVSSPDPGRALITGDASDVFQSLNAFKIPTLWGVNRTAPYFHDNSAKTLEDLMKHYVTFFAIATDPSFDGNPAVILTERDQEDIIAFLKRLR